MGFKIKYDTTNVDRSKKEIKPPKPGIYKMKITEVKIGESNGGDPMLTFVVRMQENKSAKESKGYGFWDRVTLTEAAAWKLDQYLVAIGIDTTKKKKGTLDADKFLNVEVMGRVKSGMYDGAYSPELAAVLPMPDDDDDDDEDDDDDDEDSDDDDSDDDDEDDEDEDEDDEDEDEEDDDDDDDDDDDEDDDDDDDEPEPEPVKKKSKAAAAPAPAKKAKAAPAPAAPAKKARKPKYEDMDLEDLRAEAKRRGLPTKGSQSAVIARLRTNDEDPFSES